MFLFVRHNMDKLLGKHSLFFYCIVVKKTLRKISNKQTRRKVGDKVVKCKA